jgi:hypothetical protein
MRGERRKECEFEERRKRRARDVTQVVNGDAAEPTFFRVESFEDESAEHEVLGDGSAKQFSLCGASTRKSGEDFAARLVPIPKLVCNFIPHRELGYIQRMVKQSTVDRQIGKRYGRYTVLSFSHRHKATQYFYNCQCDCGTLKKVRLGSLQSSAKGNTRSCGCYGRERSIASHTGNTYRRLNAGQAALNSLFSRYKRDSARRSIQFELTIEDFTELTSGACYYCDAPPTHEIGTRQNFGLYRYNGVDRVDNDEGYSRINCVPCCTTCNSVKNGITKSMIYKLYHLLFKP